MTTNYSHAVRMLICEHCGAPLEVPTAGGHVCCGYCSVVSEVAGRREEAEIASAAANKPTNEPQRFQRLLAQDGRPQQPPADLQQYIVAGVLPVQMLHRALQDWSITRKKVEQGGAYPMHERLYFLAMLLNGALTKQNEDTRRRAMLETTLEVLPASRHKQVLRGMLSRQAAREGNLQAAAEWLAPCDPYSDDIYTDTAFRFSQAYLATAKRDWKTVVHHLGHRLGMVPIADGEDAVCGMLRANAHEQQGQLAEAVAQLRQLTYRSGLGPLHAIQRHHPELRLCAGSLAQVAQVAQAQQAQHVQQVGAPAKDIAGFSINPAGCALMLVPAAFLAAGIVTIAQPHFDGVHFDGASPLQYGLFAMAALSGLGVAALLRMVHRHKRGRAQFENVAIDATAQIISVTKTGHHVRYAMEVVLQLKIFAGDLPPYLLAHKKYVNMLEIQQLQPGLSIALKVDPNNPTDIKL